MTLRKKYSGSSEIHVKVTQSSLLHLINHMEPQNNLGTSAFKIKLFGQEKCVLELTWWAASVLLFS